MITLVLLPGLDGTEVLLRPLVASLPKWVRPIVLTYPPSGDDSYPALLSLVRAAIADERECHVLGWSFAGPLALMLAAAEPNKVKSVILSASFVRAPTRLLPALRFALVPLAIWVWRAARRLPLLLASGNALRQAKAETWRRVPARAIAARMRAIAAVDASALLEGCQQPVLYISASADGIVPGRSGAEVRRLRPTTRFVTIHGPHLAMFSNAPAAAQAIIDFIGHEAVTSAREYRAASS